MAPGLRFRGDVMFDRILSSVFGWGFIFTIIWCVFAYFDIFTKSDTLIVYRLGETVDRVGSQGQELPSLIGKSPIEYRIVNDRVTLKYRSGDITDYENCKIFDVKNWSCTFSDGSATFGAKSGKFFENMNTIKYPHLATYGEEITVNRFQYVWNQCEWYLASNKVLGILECALVPFFM